MSTDLYVWFAIALLALSTLVTRSGMLLLGTNLKLPPRVDSALRYAPACALAAIIVPDLLFSHGHLHLGFDNFRLLAACMAIGVFAVTRSTIGTIVGGMLAFWLLRAVFG